MALELVDPTITAPASPNQLRDILERSVDLRYHLQELVNRDLTEMIRPSFARLQRAMRLAIGNVNVRRKVPEGHVRILSAQALAVQCECPAKF